jgi:hypothetical protein
MPEATFCLCNEQHACAPNRIAAVVSSSTNCFMLPCGDNAIRCAALLLLPPLTPCHHWLVCPTPSPRPSTSWTAWTHPRESRDQRWRDSSVSDNELCVLHSMSAVASPIHGVAWHLPPELYALNNVSVTCFYGETKNECTETCLHQAAPDSQAASF